MNPFKINALANSGSVRGFRIRIEGLSPIVVPDCLKSMNPFEIHALRNSGSIPFRSKDVGVHWEDKYCCSSW